ncbi:MAG: regulatory protein GemA [Syntrophorhabdales bacterium]
MSEKRMIAPYQVKLIRVLKSLLRRDDKTYRGALEELYGVTTSKALTYAQAAQFIGHLRAASEEFGLRTPESYVDKYKNLGHRIDMATPAQLRMVEGIWNELYPEADERRRQVALSTYLFRFFRISHPQFMDSQAASKVLHALKEMQARKERTTQKPLYGPRSPEMDTCTRQAPKAKYNRA